MSKSVEIDLSSDRLIAIASDMVDEHNYIGALKMLNKNAELTGNDEDSYMLYAEIFDDMGLHEKSIHHWFKYMDLAEFSPLAECYEGLAVSYMNLGNDHFSAYYYNKLLIETDEVDEATREQIVQDFLSAEENPLKFVYPPKIADVSGVMSAGISYMKQGDFESAAEQFGQVAEGNPKWCAARNYIAMCHIIADRHEEAEAECRKVLAKFPGNVQALTTLAAVKSEAGKVEEARALTAQLLTLNVKDAEEIYKIATVCCENKMHAEAYDLLCKMDEEYGYDVNILYFKAISAFNCKKFEECFASFDKLLTIYPDAVTAQFHYRSARNMVEEGDWQEMSYFYMLPQEIRQSSVKMLAAFLKLSKKQALTLAEELNISGPVKWCFDDTNPNNSQELQHLAAQVAIKAEMDDYVRDLLLHPFLDDGLKIEILGGLAERNEENSFGVVICNVFKRVTMRKLNTGRQKHVYFVRAYARLVSHFSILDDKYGEMFAIACENLYSRLEGEGRLEVAKDEAALAAAVFEAAGVYETGINIDNLCVFFDITEERLAKIRGEI